MADNPNDADNFTRRSFTFRRMKSWQIWSLAIFVVLLLIAYFLWA
jgi:hypothetical protein